MVSLLGSVTVIIHVGCSRIIIINLLSSIVYVFIKLPRMLRLLCVPLVGIVAAVFIVCFENALLPLVPVLGALLLASLSAGDACISLARVLASPALESFLLDT